MKIYLLTPRIFYYSISKAIVKNNVEIVDYSYKTLPDLWIFKKLVGKIGFIFNLYSYLSFNRKVSQLLGNLYGDNNGFILSVRGNYLTKKNKNKLKTLKFPKIISWTIDSLKRHPSQNGLFNYSSQLYLHDCGDLIDNRSFWMPFGYDDELFYSDNKNKNIDVLFVGNLYSGKYKQRLRYLLMLENSRISSKYSCIYVGRSNSIILNFFLRLRLKKIKRAGKVNLMELASFLMRSKICVNIHQDDGKMPINPMFFAIPATGTCMLTDSRDYFSLWLKENIDYVPINYKNFIDNIESLLLNPNRINSIIKHGLKSASKYSFAICIERIINNHLAIKEL